MPLRRAPDSFDNLHAKIARKTSQAKLADVSETAPQQRTVAAPPPIKSSAQSAERERYYVSIPLPAPGISPLFDGLIAAGETPTKATLLVLKRAWDDYETELLADFDPKTPRLDPYVTQKGTAATNKRIAIDAATVARTRFDPMAVKSNGTLGREMGLEALSRYFARESGSLSNET